MSKDIFISYKNDNAGNNFAMRLKDDLENHGYSVYFNSDEAGSGHFPERLKEAIRGCKDFILIVSHGCLSQLMAHHKVDWIREEILTAQLHNKHIIPILMSGVEMPKDKDDMPEELRFLPDIDAISMPEQYKRSPFDMLLKAVISKAEKDDIYRDTYNCNSQYDVVSDFTETLSKARAGEPEAMYELANMYFYGFADSNGESNRSFEEAYNWFKRLSDGESEYTALADSMIAKMYYRGIVPREKQSYEKSLEYHRKAAPKSGYSAQQLAFMLSIGVGCEFNFETAEKEYLSAIEHGDNVAYSKLADMYIGLGKMKEAAELYERISDVFPEAEYKLGCMYKRGILSDPPRPDYFRAAFYFQHVISRGGCGANVYYDLGVLYFCPTGGFIKDFKIAQENFLIAADMGHVDAQYQVAYMYEHGHVERDINKAIHYHTLAAKQGHFLSPTHLAQIYQMSECKNYHKAFKFATLAAEIGEKEGEFVLGNLLFFGRGCEPDVNKAYEMYSRAYEHGVDQAKFMMRKIEALR